jgi:hypothetical protein
MGKFPSGMQFASIADGNINSSFYVNHSHIPHLNFTRSSPAIGKIIAFILQRKHVKIDKNKY